MSRDSMVQSKALDSREIACLWPSAGQIGAFEVPETLDCREAVDLKIRKSGRSELQ